MIYWLTCAVARFILRLYFRIRVVGLERVPKSGPLIIASNHASTMDPVVVGAFLPRKVHYMAKDDLFANPLANWYLRKILVFPISRGKGDRGAIRQALGFLQSGEALGIFPEGTRSLDGRLSPAQPGMAMMASRSGAPILTVGIVGAFRAFPKGTKFPRPLHIELRIGELFTAASLGFDEPGPDVDEAETHGAVGPAPDDERKAKAAASRREARRRLEAAGATVMESIGRLL